MEMTTPPVPKNEMERLMALTDLDLDYSNLQETFSDLTKLAAKVAGMPISLVNIIDTFTQWTVSSFNLPIEQMDREESVCQYTIMQEELFEVKDLSADDRFKDKFYVTDEPNIRYYFGVPLKTADGFNLGALCLLDKEKREISPEKVEMLKIIAQEIVIRLQAQKTILSLNTKVSEANSAKLSVAHDIRGPLSGIMSLAQVICKQGDQNKLEDVLQFINLIYKSSQSLLDLANEILSEEKGENIALKANQMNLVVFKEKLEKLYTPQALNKKIVFAVKMPNQFRHAPFGKNKLLQITGNLISNAIKFTPPEGRVEVELNYAVDRETGNVLSIVVRDSGVGIEPSVLNNILQGFSTSTTGTSGEQGYGFGLSLVRHLVESLKGSIKIHSTPSTGTAFIITLPQESTYTATKVEEGVLESA